MAELSVWAPRAERVRAQVSFDDRSVTEDLVRGADGWWASDIPLAQPGARYGFLLGDDDRALPDPRSRRQPDGVHGLSALVSDEFDWTDESWHGRPLAGAVLYELHIGTFTADGTFDAAIEHLDHLADLGITHVEILPVNDFNGTHNWGYDGVLWYAVHETYGGPEGLKRFVDACHLRGLAVVLDVVYNHLGPSGNYLPEYGPYLKTGRNTWGDLLNLDDEGSPEVRRYICDNALMWFDTFHIDALRLDAVHALQDTSEPHILAQLSTEVEALSAHLQRPLVLIAESDLNDPVMITSREAGGFGLDGQWDDDVHHSLHALLSGETQGYYCDFGSLDVLAKTWTHGFFHDGTYSTFRGADHGKPVDRVNTPGYRFVVTLQNHDQVGNRAAGDRLPEIASAGMVRVGAVLLLTSPFTPMLWMGEEWAASTRWTFFTSHPEPELAEATGKGRIEEFGRHGWDVSQMIDPQDPAAFTNSKLNWTELVGAEHAEVLDLYRRLISLRKQHAELSDPRLDAVAVDFDSDAGWSVITRGDLRVVVNVSTHSSTVPVAGVSGVLLATDPGVARVADGVQMPAESAAVVSTSPISVPGRP